MTNLDPSLTDSSQLQDAALNPPCPVDASPWTLNILAQKLLGGGLLALGFLLSPLSWWNDLLFNLPIAYGFGYLCNWLVPGVLVPAAIAGYWVSNVLGIVLMQMGAIKVFQKESQPNNLKKKLLTGLISSTAYTVVIVLLIQLKVLEGLQLPFDLPLGL